MHVTGQCHCGYVQYEAELDPANVSICHCTDCQIMSGSPFRVSARVPAANFRLLTGLLSSYVKTAESGNQRAQSFCPTCGTSVHSSDVTNPQSYSLRIGALAQRAELAPRRQIWCKSSLPWVRSVSDLPAFAKQA